MNIIKFVLMPFLICPSTALFSQEVKRDPATYAVTNLNEAVSPAKSVTRFDIDNPSLNSSKNIIKYDDIKGSPFWNDKPQLAVLYNNSKHVATVAVRINFATDEIYFLKDSTELILDNGSINKIVFMLANDSSVFISDVQNLLFKKKGINGFVEVLNFGKYQLLKHTKRKFISSGLISPTGKIDYCFTNTISYFIMQNDKVENVKKLSKKNILSLLPSSSNFEATINENKINFKEEKDVVFFLNYYNLLNK